jgi:nucleotide-binding universal stress UspA family protein
MFKHIVVPLDGSELSEAALSAACFIARILNSSVTLVHIIEEKPPGTVHGTRHLTGADEAGAYLAEVARTAFPASVAVDTHVHNAPARDVARGIVKHRDEFDYDLVIMCTHGQRGLRRILLGSIAQQVVASGSVPVLLINPEHSRRDQVFSCEALLVPLDGNPANERGLDIAERIAGAAGARLHLLSVVPTWTTLTGRHATTGRFSPTTTDAVLGLTADHIRAYLAGLTARLERSGITAASEVVTGNIVSLIVQEAGERGAGIIVLGTHGTKGVDAFWAQSIAARVLQKTNIPLLLIPMKEGVDEAPGEEGSRL